MENQAPFGLDRYLRMRDRNTDYSRALARTNLAIRCWLARVGDDCRDESGHPPRHRVLAWLLANHIVQGFYRRIGIDVIPFSCGGMYGYGLSVGVKAESCGRKDVGETAWVACGSVRVDSKVGDEREYPVTDSILSGEDPLWAIDKAAKLAIGSQWPDRCTEPHCRHKQDAEVYLTIYQIITLLLAILGKARLGFSQRDVATEGEAVIVMKRIANEANLSLAEVDSWLWHLCAKGYGNICGETPQCVKCKLQDSCAYPKKDDGQVAAHRVDVKVSTGPYCLAASGTLFTIDGMPIVMTLCVDNQQTISVEVQYHDDFHPEGLSLVRSKSECSAVERWDIYQSNDGVCCRTTKPVPIMVYQSDKGMRTVFLQMGAQQVAESTYKVEYAWFEVDGDMLSTAMN